MSKVKKISEDVVAYQFAFIRFYREWSGELLNVGLVMTTEEGDFWVYLRPDTERMKACWPDFNDGTWASIRDAWLGQIRGFLEDSETPTVEELLETFDLEQDKKLIQTSHVMSGIHIRPEERFAHLRSIHVDHD